MKKSIIAVFVILLTLAITGTGCGKSRATEMASTASSKQSENEPDTQSEAEVEEEIISDLESDEVDWTELEDEVDGTPKVEIPYVGTYRNDRGEGANITVTEDGRLQYLDSDIDIDNNQDDGSILAWEKESGPNVTPSRMYIYPVGVPLAAYNKDTFEDMESDKSRLRLFLTFSDVPDIRSNVYYRVEPLPLDALSYLPQPNTFYEFSEDGIMSANGWEWATTYFMAHEESDGGDIKEEITSVTQDGQQVDLKYVNRDYIYYEDETGLYSRNINVYPIALPELRIKYPLNAGEKFQSSNFYGLGTIGAINETVTTAAGVFKNVVVVNYEYGEGGYGEKQYFAPGVGLIKYEAVRSSGELVSVSQ